MNPNPEKLNKYLYIEKTPTWLVRAIYLFGIVSWLLVVFGFTGLVVIDPFYRWVIAPIIVFFTIYHIASFGLNLFYQQFDLKKHHSLIEKFWISHIEPTIDIFLPICGEDVSVLRNTWKYVSQLQYRNKHVYVLDDSMGGECIEHERMTKEYGFNYLSRPNKGEMKKAGNLKYAYERTEGEFIVIFDADFAPHHNFLKELLPYMQDQKVGIVQSPQYFETNSEVHHRSPLQYGAGYSEEPFYRFIQVTRNRLGGTICCGSNAIYRRVALDQIDGTAQVPYSEDARTGFRLASKGWKIQYVPVLLAVGLCPENAYSYFHQQHRWCMGSMSLMLSREFWRSPISWKTRLCYVTGFMFYLHHPLTILFSFQLFWALFFYNQYISLANAVLFYPHLLFAIIYLGFFPILRFRWGVFYAMLMQVYSYSHAIVTAFLNNSVSWIPTNVRHMSVSAAFRQTMVAVSIYVFVYLSLIALTIRKSMLHPLNYDYYSVQFWLFYNLILSCILLWQMYWAVKETQSQQVANGAVSNSALIKWQIKTAGLYVVLTLAVFFGILYL